MNGKNTSSKLKSQNQKPQIPDGWLAIGTIVAPQGLDGEVRVYPDSDFPERFVEPGQRWLLRPGKTEPEPIELIEGRDIPGKGLYVVALEGIEDRSQAEALRDCVLLVPESDRPELGEDEYHVVDLIGLEVFLQETGESIGTVTDVIPAGNDLLEVQLYQEVKSQKSEVKISDPPLPTPDYAVPMRRTPPPPPASQLPTPPRKVLIPFVKAIAPVVDLEMRRIEIAPPPGLLEL
ncbi:ribosome maturation factor RimM [Chroococcidiopsis sp. CCALA 051]|uniref:ribosome maturation factor RimM n=1 Tax=Chroococcidiopsis sp. CCALA 051 TaxID=869949 RepID=UPI000D0D1738|nr:ribosome maturation factor RimM [Chroococcidiopsis sp. CCALA 051]PSM47123.1 ribosome maturation factor RimM [Chroococcidiopsis sp. CCALA 051]